LSNNEIMRKLARTKFVCQTTSYLSTSRQVQQNGKVQTNTNLTFSKTIT